MISTNAVLFFWLGIFCLGGLLAYRLCFAIKYIGNMDSGNPGKRVFPIWCLVTLSLLITFLSLELAFRVRHYFVRDIPFWGGISRHYHSELGWKGKEYSSNDRRSEKKILIIGDSFTEGMEVDEEYLYPSVLARSLPASVTAYGGQGYGTLQQLIALEKFYDPQDFDLIVLQLCSNDFINNHYTLERLSHFQNSQMMRPYLINGKRSLRLPTVLWKTQLFFVSSSRLFHFLVVKTKMIISLFAHMKLLTSVESVIATRGTDYPPFAESVEVTEQLLTIFNKRVKGVPIIAFVADVVEPSRSEFRVILERLSIPFDEEIALKLHAQNRAEESITTSDRVHWNRNGHRIVGNMLTEKIKNMFSEVILKK